MHQNECKNGYQIQLRIATEFTKVKTKSGLMRNENLLYTICPVQEKVNYKLEGDLATLPEQNGRKKKR